MTFFALGRQSTLSAVEIATVLGPDFDFSLASREILILKDLDTDLIALQERLAGTIKLGKVLQAIEIEEISETIASNILSQENTGKVKYGISVYDGGNEQLAKQLEKKLQALGLEAKKIIKKEEISIRYVSGTERSLSSVIVKTNRLIESGGEFVLIATPEGILLGKTSAVQDFKAWSKRDFGRPARDSKSGMLPPKLARMMVNLSGANKDSDSILDPFCGSGTILMEAALMGFSKITGSDVSEKAVEDTRQNLIWLVDKYSETLEEGKEELAAMSFELEYSDAAELGLHTAVDAIVSETFLGPPQTGRESKQDITRIEAELMETYRDSFENLFNLLKPGGNMTIAFPAFVRGKKIHFLPIKKMLLGLGLKLVKPLPKSFPDTLQRITPNGGLLYQREKQRVAREIIIVTK